MSYKLDKEIDFTESERADFIVRYNHNMGLEIVETEDAIYALEKNEIMEDGIPVLNPNYEQELVNKRREKFEKEFFQTSLGWIRRTVNMKDGSKKDFLSDLLLQIKAGIELGQDVTIITYNEPDYTQEVIDNYEALQERKLATLDFIAECLNRTVLDFGE